MRSRHSDPRAQGYMGRPSASGLESWMGFWCLLLGAGQHVLEEHGSPFARRELRRGWLGVGCDGRVRLGARCQRQKLPSLRDSHTTSPCKAADAGISVLTIQIR